MCDGSARGWLAGNTDGLAGWPVTVGQVSLTVTVSVMVTSVGDGERVSVTVTSVGDGLADARKADLKWKL